MMRPLLFSTLLASSACTLIGNRLEPPTPTPLQASSVTAGDLDGDAQPDIIFVTDNMFDFNTGEQHWAIGLLPGSQDFAANLAGSFSRFDFNGNQPSESRLDDLDGDQDLDLVAFLSVDGVIHYALNNGSGGFPSEETLNISLSDASFQVQDLNGDDRGDLFLTSSIQKIVEISLNNGAGVFLPPQSLSMGAFTFSALGDFDGDGDPDIAFTTPNLPFVGLSKNNAGVFSPIENIFAGLGLAQPIAADFNGDQTIDLLSLDTSGRALTLFNNGGALSFSTQTTTNLPVMSLPRAFDVDSDGDLDLVEGARFTGLFGGFPLPLLRNENGSFVEGTPIQINNQALGLGENDFIESLQLNDAIDLDGDQDLDLLGSTFIQISDPCCGQSSNIIILQNQAGSFSIKKEATGFLFQ